MKEITLDTKIADLLNDYDGMKEILIKINPKFKKLNNPVLKRTLAKIAGVKQAAIVGGMDPADLLNQLRKAVGQSPLEGTASEAVSPSQAPSWIESEPQASLNANEILDRDKNPLAEAHQVLKKLEKGDIMTIIADFRPEPLIEEFVKAGYEVYCRDEGDSRFVTYVKK